MKPDNLHLWNLPVALERQFLASSGKEEHRFILWRSVCVKFGKDDVEIACTDTHCLFVLRVSLADAAKMEINEGGVYRIDGSTSVRGARSRRTIMEKQPDQYVDYRRVMPSGEARYKGQFFYNAAQGWLEVRGGHLAVNSGLFPKCGEEWYGAFDDSEGNKPLIMHATIEFLTPSRDKVSGHADFVIMPMQRRLGMPPKAPKTVPDIPHAGLKVPPEEMSGRALNDVNDPSVVMDKEAYAVAAALHEAESSRAREQERETPEQRRERYRAEGREDDGGYGNDGYAIPPKSPVHPDDMTGGGASEYLRACDAAEVRARLEAHARETGGEGDGSSGYNGSYEPAGWQRSPADTEHEV